MILDNMTIQEVGKSLLRTARENDERFKTIVAHCAMKYRRAVIRRRCKTNFIPIKRMIENIDFYICPYSYGKKEMKKNAVWFCLIATFIYQRKRLYCTIDESSEHVTLYTTHFLERYIERHLKDSSQPGIDTLRKFEDEINHIDCVMHVKDPIYDNRIIAGTRFGIGCGYKVSDSVFMFKTYIDKETIRSGEKRRVLQTSKSLLTPIGVDKYDREVTRLEVMDWR